MTELTKDDVPAYHDFFDDLVAALKELGGSGTNQEIYAKVIEMSHLTDDQINVLHNDGPMTEVEYRLRWTQTYLKKDGIIENVARGVWGLLPKGREVSKTELNQTRDRVKGTYRAARADKKENSTREVDRDDEMEEEAGLEIEEEISWNAKLLRELKNMDPIAFERLSQRLLRESGFVKVTVTSASNDKGIDGVGVLRMNLVSFQVMFQCKRYSGTVGPGAVRDFRGAMQGRSDKGLIITTGTFTAEARREAVRDGAPTIDLIDGDALCDLLKERKLGVSVKMVEQVNIDATFFKNI